MAMPGMSFNTDVGVYSLRPRLSAVAGDVYVRRDGFAPRPSGCSILRMQPATGTVIDRKVVLEGATLPDGAVVTALDRTRMRRSIFLRNSRPNWRPQSPRLTAARQLRPQNSSKGFAVWPELVVLAAGITPRAPAQTGRAARWWAENRPAASDAIRPDLAEWQ